MHHPQVHVMNEQEYFDKRFLDESFEWYRERQPYTTLDQIGIQHSNYAMVKIDEKMYRFLATILQYD